MKLFERFCEAFNIEFGDTDELAELVEFTPPPGGSGLSTPVARTAAENTIEQLEVHIDHLGDTLTEVRAERDELHRMVIENKGGHVERETIRRAQMATEVAAVLDMAKVGPRLPGMTLAERVTEVAGMAQAALEVHEVLRPAVWLDEGLTMAGKVFSLLERHRARAKSIRELTARATLLQGQRDLARSEARRYAARLGKL